jgi:hypothetical protein
MAKVPEYNTPQVQPNAPRPPQLDTPPLGAAGNAAEQLQRTGQAIQQGGEMFGRIAAAEQQKANDLQVIDAENQAREAAIKLTVDPQEGYTTQQGADAVHRASGLPLADEYHQKLTTQIGQIANSLKNDVQRQAFARSAAAIGEDFYSKAASYEGQQYRQYHQSVVKGAADLAAQEVGLHYNDPESIDRSLQSLDVSTTKLGQMNGMAGNEIDALRNTARSQALSQAMEAALNADDPDTAQGLFDHYKDKMLAPDIGRIEGVLKRESIGKTALNIADQVFNAVPGTGAPQPAFERVFNALIGQESHGEAGATGPATKYGVAHGATQVLDSTGAGIAKRLGIAWRPDLMRGKSDEAKQYQLQIGRAYFQEGLQKYQGDFYKALCFYHGGPDEGKWGPKTHAYADAILAKCGAKGAAVGPTGTLEDAISAGRRMLEATDPNPSYDKVKAVEEEISRRWQQHKVSEDYNQDQTVSTAMTQLLKNGGNISKLPPSLRTQIPGDKWERVINFAKSIQEPPPRDKSHDDALYNQSVTNPDWLKSLPNSEFIHDFQGHPQFDEIAKHRAQLLGLMPVGEKDNPGTINYTTINRIVNSRLEALGVGTDAKSGNQPQVGAAQRVINQAIAGEQRRIGRQLTDAETESFIDRQFARPGVINTHSFLGLETSKKSLPLFAVPVSHIPTDELTQIDAALDRSGQPKTDQNRLTLYYMTHAR